MSISVVGVSGASKASLSANPTTLASPAGVKTGDLLVAIGISSGAGQNNAPNDSGWTDIQGSDNGGQSWMRFANTASDPATWSFQSSATTVTRMIVIAAIRGVHPIAPINVWDFKAYGNANNTTAPLVLPSLTTEKTAEFLLEMVATTANRTWGPPGTTTEDSDAVYATQNFGAAVGHEVLRGAQTTGTRTWTPSGSGAPATGIILALNPDVTQRIGNKI